LHDSAHPFENEALKLSAGGLLVAPWRRRYSWIFFLK